MIFLHVPRQSLKFLALHRQESAVAGHDDQLPEFFIERHRLQRLLHPGFRLGGQRECPRGLGMHVV